MRRQVKFNTKKAEAGIVDKYAIRDLRGAPPKELASFFSSIS